MLGFEDGEGWGVMIFICVSTSILIKTCVDDFDVIFLAGYSPFDNEDIKLQGEKGKFHYAHVGE